MNLCPGNSLDSELLLNHPSNYVHKIIVVGFEKTVEYEATIYWGEGQMPGIPIDQKNLQPTIGGHSYLHIFRYLVMLRAQVNTNSEAILAINTFC